MGRLMMPTQLPMGCSAFDATKGMAETHEEVVRSKTGASTKDRPGG
jgi:hypothetical protein